MTSCSSEYTNFRRTHRRYRKGKKGARDQFILFFTNRFLDLVRQSNDKDLKGLESTVLKIQSQPDYGSNPDNAATISETVARLMNEVYYKVEDECQSYARKYETHINEATKDLVNAVRGVSPKKASKEVESLFKDGVKKELNQERFASFLRRVRDSKDPKPNMVFGPKDVKKVLDTMLQILARVLDCEVKSIAPLVTAILKGAVFAEGEGLQKYGREIAELRKKRGGASVENLKQLLLFFAATFPEVKEVQREGGITRILEQAKESKTKLNAFYNTFRDLLLHYATSGAGTEKDGSIFVQMVEGVWATLRMPLLKEIGKFPLLRDGQAVEPYIENLVVLLERATVKIRTTMNDDCRNGSRGLAYRLVGKSIGDHCSFIKKDAEKIDRIVDGLKEFLDRRVSTDLYDKLHDRVEALARQRVLDYVNKTIQSESYSVLREALQKMERSSP